MKLTASGASPYVRKATVCTILRGIDVQIEKWAILATDPVLAQSNPLAKVPTLVTDDGLALFDSPVICEYLDSLGSAPPLFPAAGPSRWKALRLHAIGDGILDASQPRRREIALPQDEGRIAYIALQRGKVSRAVDDLEKEAGSLNALSTIGEVAVACALGYLDFRFDNEPWRPGHPKLTAWYESVVKLPAMVKTMPVAV